MTHLASVLISHHSHSEPCVRSPGAYHRSVRPTPSCAHTLHGIPTLGTGHPFSQPLTSASPQSQLVVSRHDEGQGITHLELQGLSLPPVGGLTDRLPLLPHFLGQCCQLPYGLRLNMF